MGSRELAPALAFAIFMSLSSSSAAVPVENAFLVKIPGELCTGTVIAKDWMLTAAHCFARRVSAGWRNEHGDLVIEGRKGEFVHRYVANEFINFSGSHLNKLFCMQATLIVTGRNSRLDRTILYGTVHWGRINGAHSRSSFPI